MKSTALSFECDSYFKSYTQRSSLVFCVRLLFMFIVQTYAQCESRTQHWHWAFNEIHLKTKVFCSLENYRLNPFNLSSWMKDRSINRSIGRGYNTHNGSRNSIAKNFLSGVQYKIRWINVFYDKAKLFFLAALKKRSLKWVIAGDELMRWPIANYLFIKSNHQNAETTCVARSNCTMGGLGHRTREKKL